MTISQHGHLLVGIDIGDKGYVEFNQLETDPINTKPSWMSRHNDITLLGGVDFNQDVQHLFYPQYYNDYIFTHANADTNKYINAINPFGAELTRVTLDAGETYNGVQFGKTVDSLADKWTVEPSTEYTVWLWLSADDPIVSSGGDELLFEIEELDNTDSGVDLHTQVISLPDAYDVVGFRITFTTTVDTEHIAILVYRSFAAPALVNLFIHGAALYVTEIATEPRWNAGSTTGHMDNITEYTISASGSIGKSQWEQLIFDEGQLTLELNNENRLFSPELVSSVYYGLIKPHLRIWVLFADYDGNYHMLWSGWTHQLLIQPGQWTENRATLTARQGRYMFESQDPDGLYVQDEINSSDAIKQLFSHGYEYSTSSNEVLPDGESTVENYSLGLDIPLFSVTFVDPEANDFASALEDVAELNGNYLFLTRYGRIYFHTFDEVRDSVATELPFEYTVDAEYTYSPEDVYHNIIVNYDYYRFDDDVEMQGTDQVITAGSLDFKFDVHPQFNDRPLIGDVVLDVSDFQPVNYTNTPAFGSASASFADVDKGIYKYYQTEANNSTDLDYRLSLVSRASGDVWYADAINQQFIETGTENKALPNLIYDNPLITSPFMAEAFAQLQASRRGAVMAWFNSVTLTNRNTNTLAFLLEHTLGDTIYVQEHQTGNVPKHLCIIGENWTYSNNFMQMNYTLSPTTGSVGEVCFAEFDVDIEDATLTVTFTNESEATSAPTGWLWDFGDGNTSTLAHPPPHTYATNGIYEVTLTMTTAECEDTVDHTVPVAVVPGCDCLDFDFTASDGDFIPGSEPSGSYEGVDGWKTENGGVSGRILISKVFNCESDIKSMDVTINLPAGTDVIVHVQGSLGGTGVWARANPGYPSYSTYGSGSTTLNLVLPSAVTTDEIRFLIQTVDTTPFEVFLTSAVFYDASDNIIGDC